MEGTGLVSQLVFKTSSGRITPSVAGSIPALSANFIANSDENMQEKLRAIPSVGKILNDEQVRQICDEFGHELVKFALREVVEQTKKYLDDLKNQLQVSLSFSPLSLYFFSLSHLILPLNFN